MLPPRAARRAVPTAVRRARRGTGPLVAALAALLLAAVPVPAAAQPPGPAPRTYVALGDSFTAGPFVPLPTGAPAGCLRSTRNYPRLVAAAVGAGALRDVSCSGATTEHMRAPQRTSAGTNPPQFDALDAGVDLVTLGIGGNDIGFVEIIRECTLRSATAPSGAACKAFHTAPDGTDVIAARIAATGDDVAAVLDGIAQRAPAADVVVVGYPVILPDRGPGCFPLVPFSAGDVAWLRETQQRLNAMLAARAADAGARFADTYTPSIGHDVCRLPGTKWVEGIVPTAPAAPVHPNALGMINSARAVLGELAAG